MARQLRWTIPFKSFLGVDCVVNVYAEGYDGGPVELSVNNPSAPGVAAANPFSYEEDNDSDLLSPVRVKTGYIRLVELSFGALSAMYPETATQHYVEFYYGSRLDFTGYIQPQAFESPWEPAPRDVELPVTSPLGLCGGKYFSYASPQMLFMDDIIDDIMTGLNAAYSTYILPDDVSSFRLHTLILQPFNNSPKEADGSDRYTPNSYADFLESFCLVHGLMLHDTPDALLFTRFDYDGRYADGNYGSTVLQLSQYASVAGDDNDLSVVAPLRSITIGYDGSLLPEQKFDVGQCSVFAGVSDEYWGGDTHFVATWMKLLGPTVTSRYLLDSQNIDAGYRPVNYGVIGAVRGTDGTPAVWCTRAPYMGNSDEVFAVRMFTPPQLKSGQMLIVSMKQRQVRDTLNSEKEYYGLLVAFEVDGLYYCNTGTDDRWVASPGNENMKWHSYIDGVPFYLRDVPTGTSLNLHFKLTSQVQTGETAILESISIECESYFRWSFMQYDEQSRTIAHDNASTEDGSVSLLFNRDHPNSNSIADVLDAMSTFVSPTFPYMFLAQTRLALTMRMNQMPPAIYQPKWAWWQNGWRWRIIAMAFSPVDDRYSITMHRSSINEH